MTNNQNKNLKRVITRVGILLIAVAVMSLSVSSIARGSLTETVIQQTPSKTFFSQFIIAGGPIVWFVLLPMSVFAIYLAIDLCLTIRRKKLLPSGITSRIVTTTIKFGPARLPERMDSANDLITTAIIRTIIKSQYLKSDPKYIQHLAAESLQDHATHLLRKVEWCSIIGNVAPMVGLFGTVFGMIKAFNLLGVAGGQPPPDQLAAAISVALVTTFWGLLIAIPALALHGIFQSRVESLVSEAAIEVEDVLHQLTQSVAGHVPLPRKSSLDQEKDYAQKP